MALAIASRGKTQSTALRLMASLGMPKTTQVASSELHLASHREAGVSSGYVAAYAQFVQTGLEKMARNYFEG